MRQITLLISIAAALVIGLTACEQKAPANAPGEQTDAQPPVYSAPTQAQEIEALRLLGNATEAFVSVTSTSVEENNRKIDAISAVLDRTVLNKSLADNLHAARTEIQTSVAGFDGAEVTFSVLSQNPSFAEIERLLGPPQPPLPDPFGSGGEPSTALEYGWLSFRTRCCGLVHELAVDVLPASHTDD